MACAHDEEQPAGSGGGRDGFFSSVEGWGLGPTITYPPHRLVGCRSLRPSTRSGTGRPRKKPDPSTSILYRSDGVVEQQINAWAPPWNTLVIRLSHVVWNIEKACIPMIANERDFGISLLQHHMRIFRIFFTFLCYIT